MFAAYTSSLLGLWVIITTIIVQALVASIAHRRQKKYIPGIVDAKLGQESFVFRSDRAFRNSLENIAPMFGMSVLAIFAGMDAYYLCIIIWIYAIARIIHSILYYVIATEKNPSPRSYFYIIGLFANIVLTVQVARLLF